MAHRAFGYQAAVGLAIGLWFTVVLITQGGRPGARGLAITGLIVAAVVLYHPLGDRVRFSREHVQYVSPTGRVTTSWPLDGRTHLDFDDVRTPTRWGLTAKTALVLQNAHGYGLALPAGRYTREPAWRQLLLEAAEAGDLTVSPIAHEHLSAAS